MGVSKKHLMKKHFKEPFPIRKIEKDIETNKANLTVVFESDGLKKGVFYRVVENYKDRKFQDNTLLNSAIVRTVFAGVSVVLQIIIVLKIFGVI